LTSKGFPSLIALASAWPISASVKYCQFKLFCDFFCEIGFGVLIVTFYPLTAAWDSLAVVRLAAAPK